MSGYPTFAGNSPQGWTGCTLEGDLSGKRVVEVAPRTP